MKTVKIILTALAVGCFSVSNLLGGNFKEMNREKLTPQEEAVIWGKATEAPYSGEYDKLFKDGIYVCKACGAVLYRSTDKFDSGCGWPAFDDAFPNAVKRVPDPDGRRTEIVCARCGAHLGHVFEGERLTDKNTRHCVNSISMKFIPAENIETAIVAGGCFWGVEELMRRQDGVFSVVSGYSGGKTENPDYREVCSVGTGHLEAVEVLFDKTKISYPEVLRLFFEIHDFTQTNGQGPDLGPQYLSAVFYLNDAQRQAAEGVVKQLEAKGYKVATALKKASKFWQAEDYHQRYYERKGSQPYCHMRKKIF